jgi:type II secretory pathway predicted ATPase ExeA
MYLSFYGLKEAPFELTANPKYLFFTGQHREALSNLEYGLSSAKPITLLVGEAGTGKSTLLRAALDSERCRNVSAVYLNNPTLKRDEFVETLAARFDLGAVAGHSKATLLGGLESVLLERQTRGEITALVVDEAQALSDELLEEIRLLANMETPAGKLLPLVLAGQPELGARLNEPGLRQLKQRIALRCELKPLDLAETASYIASRIRTAGGDPGMMFTREAVTVIHEYSNGVPRTVSVICDNALMSGFALDQHRIDGQIVREVCKDFDLRPMTGKPHPAPPPLALVEPVAPAAGREVPTPAVAASPAAETPAAQEKPKQGHLSPRRFSLLGLR